MAEISLLDISQDNKPIKLNLSRIISSGTIILYIWSLPYLAKIGFAEKGSTSISEFVSNAHATGAMAVLSFTPLTLMWEYQDIRVVTVCTEKGKRVLYYTLVAYQWFYGGFLVCTVNYVPLWLHMLMVVSFCISFVIHSIMTMNYTKPSKCGQYQLIVGILSCVCMPFSKGLWFWVCECVGLSMIMLFTPTEILLNY
ncbi:MAG: hypothetical protein CMF80_07150 [Candidatus Marinimicrobia bacterium]|nr:hypothetical protein [Candidatus Neomarinimicrobiota bacterium]|tara:strand:- start:1682 stop:2272 length:591 start_codon:yes stop_codon:yes gene_type:complete